MERLVGSLVGQQDSRLGGGDTFVDRLSCVYTVFVLSVFAVGVTTKQWLGDVPISCWCPAHFTSSHVQFTNRVCWTQNTFYLPISVHHIPKDNSKKEYISYYQWVALVLACQAILFYLPRPLWRMTSKKSGISVSAVIDASIDYQKSVDPEHRDKVLRYMVKHLGRFLVELARKHLMSSRLTGIWWAFYGSSMLLTYCFIKIIYLINVTGQLMMMNKFLGTDYHLYGFRVLSQMVKGESWSTSDRFPRVTLCDLSVRTMGNIHNYTVQCSLPMNLFNEKIYIFLWFWFSMVALVTFASLLHWLWISVYLPGHVHHIRHRLIALNKLKTQEEEKLISKFVRIYLRRDGLFILTMISKNSSDIVAAELICGLFDHFKENRKIIQQLNTRDDMRARKKEIKALVKEEMNKELVGDLEDLS